MKYQIPRALLVDTFATLRRCGAGERECQVLWLSPWTRPEIITEALHPRHTATGGGFDLDESWLHDLWVQLARCGMGVRVQVHTHPGAAYHSHIDDDWPVVHAKGFLSLVVPRFAQGEVGFKGAFLAEIDDEGRWGRVDINDRIMVSL